MEPKKYKIKKGDWLSKIALREYGDAQQWRRIYNANKKVLGDNPDLIYPGLKIIIPAAKKETKSQQQQSNKSTASSKTVVKPAAKKPTAVNKTSVVKKDTTNNKMDLHQMYDKVTSDTITKLKLYTIQPSKQHVYSTDSILKPKAQPAKTDTTSVLIKQEDKQKKPAAKPKTKTAEPKRSVQLIGKDQHLVYDELLKTNKHDYNFKDKPKWDAPYSTPTLSADEIRRNELKEKLRTATGLSAIKAHKQLYNVVDPWIYVDKKNHKMLIYADGNNEEPLYEYPITVGKEHGDYTTASRHFTTKDGKLTVDKRYNYNYTKQYPETANTGAGIFTINKWEPYSDYGIKEDGSRAYKGSNAGEPMIRLLMENGLRTAQTGHGPAGSLRAGLFLRMLGEGELLGNTSFGCWSPPDGVMRQLYGLNLFMDGDSVYINPEMEGNMIYHDMDDGLLKTQILYDPSVRGYLERANRSKGTRIKPL